MAYQICITKTSPCCVMTLNCINLSGTGICTTIPQCMRSLEIYGCTPDMTQGEFNDMCCQGLYSPIGNCCAWTVPVGVNSITVELWGAGTGGNTNSNNTYGSLGGGAGSYVKRTMAVCPNDLITFCSGAGGQMGISGGSSNAYAGWACLGTRGGCSFVRRNGVMCMDAQAGSLSAAATTNSTAGGGSVGAAAAVGADGCYSYGSDMSAAASASTSNGAAATNQLNLSGGSAFGGDAVQWGFPASCGQYLRWNTSCVNQYNVYGPGGGACSNSLAYNVGGNYSCTTSVANQFCDRGNAAPPGKFPGGGGGGGTSTCTVGLATGAGSGAPGYIRVYY